MVMVIRVLFSLKSNKLKDNGLRIIAEGISQNKGLSEIQ